jgi:hypothetical protein
MTPQEAYLKCKKENCRIHKLENVIATDPEWSCIYARDVIKGKFIEGEKSISTDAKNSFYYSRYVLKGPFQLCHHNIFNSKYRDEYINFLKSINYDLREIEEWLI